MLQSEISRNLKSALEQIAISNGQEMLRIIKPIEARTLVIEDLVLAHLIRCACLSIRNASGKGEGSSAFDFAIQDIAKVDHHIRSKR